LEAFGQAALLISSIEHPGPNCQFDYVGATPVVDITQNGRVLRLFKSRNQPGPPATRLPQEVTSTESGKEGPENRVKAKAEPPTFRAILPSKFQVNCSGTRIKKASVPPGHQYFSTCSPSFQYIARIFSEGQ